MKLGEIMDIRRVRLSENKNATVLSNDLVRAIIQDHNGRVVELSATNIHGGWVNCNKLHKFPFSKDTVLQDGFFYNRTNRLTALLYGCQLHVEDKTKSEIKIATEKNIEEEENSKNIKASDLGDVLIDRELKTKAENKNDFVDSLFENDRVSWVVQRYGSDQKTGGVWVLSVNTSVGNFKNFEAKRLEIVLPHQPVVYSVTYIKNVCDNDLSIDLGYDNSLGSPFLESGCIINASAGSWNVASTASKEVTSTRIKEDNKSFSLEKAPMKDGSKADIRNIPGVIGTTDVLFGEPVSKDTSHQWVSVINPRQQMFYLAFTPGKELLEDIDLPLSYSTLVMDFGGRAKEPWALYYGGTCNEFALHVGASTTCLGESEFVTLKPQEIRRVMYGRALNSYDNTRMGNNFTSFESFNHNIVLKRTKSNIVIPSDPKFEIIKQICDRIINF
jgi:hypothetical protein